MAAAAVVPPQEPAPLNEAQRLLDVFVAPSKTFTDLRRSARWWAPCVISFLISLLFVYVVDQKVGFRKVAENQLQTQPKQVDQLDRMSAADREKNMQGRVTFTRIFSYAFPIFILVWYALVAAVLLATLKLGLSADVKYKTLFALVWYSSLPGLIKSLLSIISLLAGVNVDGFTFQNPLATNPGYFMEPGAHPALTSFLTSLDVFVFWVLALAAIGITCVSKVKKGAAFVVVFGWYFALTFLGVGVAAMFS